MDKIEELFKQFEKEVPQGTTTLTYLDIMKKIDAIPCKRCKKPYGKHFFMIGMANGIGLMKYRMNNAFCYKRKDGIFIEDTQLN